MKFGVRIVNWCSLEVFSYLVIWSSLSYVKKTKGTVVYCIHVPVCLVFGGFVPRRSTCEGLLGLAVALIHPAKGVGVITQIHHSNQPESSRFSCVIRTLLICSQSTCTTDDRFIPLKGKTVVVPLSVLSIHLQCMDVNDVAWDKLL